MDNRKYFPELAKYTLIELENLRKYATPQELEKLNFTSLRPNDIHKCIYGQMTGSCYSSRANELIYKCTEKVWAWDKLIDIKETHRNNIYTPLEEFIRQYPIYNKSIIKYLKGEIQALDLK